MPESTQELQTRIQTLEAELTKYQAEAQRTQALLKRFDELDFVAYNQGARQNDFSLFNELHTEDVRVFDAGSIEPVTTTIHDHDQSTVPAFQMLPDHQVVAHPIAFGQGDWTCVLGVIEGSYPGTGKHFKVKMATVAKWSGERIAEEYLFIPMDTIMKQVS